MCDVVVLGSGTPNPVAGRGGAAVAIVGEAGWVLVDCGRAATQRAIDAGLDLQAILAVAITHHHSDHVSDLATLAMARWTAGATGPLTVVVPEGPAANYARGCLGPFGDQAFYAQAMGGGQPTIEVHVFEPAGEVRPVFDVDGWELASALVDHHPIEPAVGYRIEHDGGRVAVSGDTAVCDGVRALAQGVNVLVHEALLSSRASPELLAWNAGARDVGELAAEVRPGTLILTHLIPAPTSSEDEQAYLEEVRAGGFAGTTLVAYDGLRVSARHNRAGRS